MNRDDLLKMLDLGGHEAAPRVDSSLAFSLGPAAPALESATALVLDGWGLRRGEEVLAESERLAKTGLDAHAAADFHGAAFEPEPILNEGCVDARRHEFLTRLLETPDYHALHRDTMLDAAASAIAAAAFAEQFAALVKEDERPGGERERDREMAALRAAGRAAAEAAEEVGELGEARAALGIGPGSPGSNDPPAIAALFRRVRNSPLLRRVCELAGRYRRVAQSAQRRKTSHGVDDVVGVELGGDVGRLLPHELARLADDDLCDDAMRRLVERQAMCREYHAVEPVAKGPILVCCDESGSMQGEKGHAAKALALALAWVARSQNRWCALVAYSGDSGERVLALPPGCRDEAALLGWLEPFIGGGSSIDVPVRELPRIYREVGAPAGTTDVIFVTDAQCRLPAEVREGFLTWKASAKARLVTLVVGGEAGDLALISDEVHLVRTLDASEEAVGRVLSV